MDTQTLTPTEFTLLQANERAEMAGITPIREIHTLGNLHTLSLRAVAIVGSRNATPLGLERAYKIAHHFASEGFCIVSGMATGIDQAAHKGALDAGGATIAVLGTSLSEDDVYGANAEQKVEALALRRRIAASPDGLLITEYAQKAYNPRRFVERDRIQALLSLAVIPVEMGRQSGTMHTCRVARSLGMPIWMPAYPTGWDEGKLLNHYGGFVTIKEDWRYTHCRFFTGDDYDELDRELRMM